MWFFGDRRPRGEGLRVLFCTMGYPPDGSGGSQHQAALLGRALRSADYSVDVICPQRGGQKSGAVDGVPVKRLTGYEQRMGRYRLYHWRLLLYLLVALPRYDIVHVHTADHQLRLICLAARLWRKPVYAKAAAGGEGADLQRLQRRGRADAILRYVTLQAISDEIAEEWQVAGVSPDRIVRLPNGVDIQRHKPATPEEKRSARASLGLPIEGVVVLYMGRFHANKGIGLLLAVWRQNPPTGATLLAAGAQDSDEVATSPTPSPSIQIRRWTEDTASYLAAADVFVLPSRREGMSNALLEAMASGLAVVATRVGAAEEMIEDGVSGVLIDIDDGDGLAKALQRLVDDSTLRERLGRAAEATVTERYSVGSVASRIVEVYRAMLARR